MLGEEQALTQELGSMLTRFEGWEKEDGGGGEVEAKTTKAKAKRKPVLGVNGGGGASSEKRAEGAVSGVTEAEEVGDASSEDPLMVEVTRIQVSV